MLIYRIFEEIKDKLYAVAYDETNTNILNILQENWSDILWLEEFFEKNKQDLQSGFYGSIQIEEAITRTFDEQDDLFIALKEHKGESLSTLFQPLRNQEYQSKEYQEQKAKGKYPKSWLRIYAVHFDDQYVITGGAIKLTRTMMERDHTALELKKLRMVRDALKLNEADDLFVYLDL